MTAQNKPLDFYWFIPVGGDGSYLGTDKGQRPADFRYLAEIAQAVDRLGYEGVLLPVGRNCEDPWIVAAALAPLTRKLKFLAASARGVSWSISSLAAIPRNSPATAFSCRMTSATIMRRSF